MKYPKAVIKEEVKDVIVIDRNKIILPGSITNVVIRSDGNFKDLGYYLSRQHDHIIVEDNAGYPVLVSLKKELNENL